MPLRDMLREALAHAEGAPAREVSQLLLQEESRLGPTNDGILYAYVCEALEALRRLAERIHQEQPILPEDRPRK